MLSKKTGDATSLENKNFHDAILNPACISQNKKKKTHPTLNPSCIAPKKKEKKCHVYLPHDLYLSISWVKRKILKNASISRDCCVGKRSQSELTYMHQRPFQGFTLILGLSLFCWKKNRKPMSIPCPLPPILSS